MKASRRLPISVAAARPQAARRVTSELLQTVLELHMKCIIRDLENYAPEGARTPPDKLTSVLSPPPRQSCAGCPSCRTSIRPIPRGSGERRRASEVINFAAATKFFSIWTKNFVAPLNSHKVCCENTKFIVHTDNKLCCTSGSHKVYCPCGQ